MKMGEIDAVENTSQIRSLENGAADCDRAKTALSLIIGKSTVYRSLNLGKSMVKPPMKKRIFNVKTPCDRCK